MNELIESIFTNFTVDGVSVPVKYLYYEGHGEPYVTYQQVYGENPLHSLVLTVVVTTVLW